MKISDQPILLVEDDQVDVMTVRRALEKIHVTRPVDCRQFVEVMRTIDACRTISKVQL